MLLAAPGCTIQLKFNQMLKSAHSIRPVKLCVPLEIYKLKNGAHQVMTSTAV
jgi:hypothetical protein